MIVFHALSKVYSLLPKISQCI